MPNWGDVLDSLREVPNPLDDMRRKYLRTVMKTEDLKKYNDIVREPAPRTPAYTTPEKQGKNLKRYSLLKPVTLSYSNRTTLIEEK